MHRYFIELAYDGTNYHGWQIQKNAVSVQEKINEALSTILQHPVNVTGAGRTDTGVHAKKMFAHFDNQILLNNEIIYPLNQLLPNDIAIYKLYKVENEAHARFDAISRTYNYLIATYKNPFMINRAYYFKPQLNLTLMNEACKNLFNHQDFSCFSKSNTQTHTNNCKIFEAQLFQENGLITFKIKADRFLRNMVRAIMGTLIDVGLQKISLDDFEEIISSKDRSNAGVSVPAHGLYLTHIEYPKNIFDSEE
jgi:tRNA pseudouridine38-40 synthase